MPFAYDHEKIEKKWQRVWEQENLFKADDFSKKKKYYILVEFPYPSGDRLHTGHARSYTALDAVARKKRMEGYNVLFPFGWDAFGLPAENYAIKTGIHPSITTKRNIENSKKQAMSWGLSFDWSREINTTDPQYYKWTQWIFLRLFKKGLAYRAKIPVNWCPSCKINLANEEVLSGKCERCGYPTERRMQTQYLLKITKYAQRLLDDLDTVDYREDIKRQQINWIGRKSGAVVKFKVGGLDKYVSVFTTRIETLFGVTALIIAPDKIVDGKNLALLLSANGRKAEVEKYIRQTGEKSELERTEIKEKTGIFTGSFAVNPINGEKVPVWVADYVIGWYGRGAVMLVPSHDKRDFEFAEKYKIGLKNVIESKTYPFEGEGKLINSGEFNDMQSKDAQTAILEKGREEGWAEKEITYKLRDWVFSRQHYWGEPIPIIHCEKCGAVPVPESDLPVELPFVEKYLPTDTGESPLAKVSEWVNTSCPSCGGAAKRETDTMPNWAGSSWYFLRYADPANNEKFADFKKLKYWLMVDWYNGGMEHTTLHLLYSRFWHKFLFDEGLVPTPEPYAKRTSHGVVLGPDGKKMSKSKGNVINPDDIVEAYGADTLRVYEMFMGPFSQRIVWDPGALRGVRRFLDRIWISFEKVRERKVDKSDKEILAGLHKTIKRVGRDLERMKFNTAVAAMMEFVNLMEEKDCKIRREDFKLFILLIAPFAPHLADEIWRGGSFGSASVHKESWPSYEESLVAEKNVTIPVTVNGKLRASVVVSKKVSESEEEVIERALRIDAVKARIEGKSESIRWVYVPGKILNIVV